MVRRIVALVSALTAALIVFVNIGSSFLIEGLADGDAGVLPQVGTLGQTVLVYSYASTLLAFVLGVLVVAGLGYWAGQRLDVADEYPSLAAAFAGGGAVGSLLAMASVFALAGGPDFGSLLSTDVFFLAAPLLGNAAAFGIRFLLVGLAGAALAEFGFDPLAGWREPSADEKPVDEKPVDG